MKKILMILAIAGAAASVAAGHGGGMSGGGMMAGSGMLTVADDSSLLVTNMNSAAMMNGNAAPATDRELVNLDANGNERWRVSFEDGWPMMPATNGDLVVIVLVDDWFMGFGGMGDGGWGQGNMGGGMGGGVHGPGDDDSTVVALDLATGQERWRSTVAGDMASLAQFSPDGARIYVSAVEMGSGGGMGPGSVRQGDAAGAGFMSSSTVVAFDRAGNRLWSYDLGGE